MYTRTLPYRDMRRPAHGEQRKMTAANVANIMPVASSSMPFFAASCGKNAARTEYTAWQMRLLRFMHTMISHLCAALTLGLIRRNETHELYRLYDATGNSDDRKKSTLIVC